ncbi:periplasmic heavy metal sensor [Rhodocyclus tenuis]|uniref:Periplasmic heavy metal sensor n=2 Tax=Rhodocyclus TaxID=1064 RepID=A0A6L5JX10_RHOTE|nr:periplasmic heavy metal sensor [Rhodocyclus gracilis]
MPAPTRAGQAQPRSRNPQRRTHMHTTNKSTSSRTLRRFLATAAIGLGLGAASTSFALPPDGGCDGRARGDWSAEHGGHGSPLRELGRLHDELKLDAKQEALWKDAEQATRDARKDSRERLREEHEKTLAALDQPNADLRAIFKAHDETHADIAKRHEASRERWFAFYDSLNPNQREKARLFLRKMIDHAGHAAPDRR